jgi:cystine transport system ATP-binding protein
VLSRYRARSGTVFQSHNLFPRKTVLENLTEGPVVVQGRPRAEAVADAEVLFDEPTSALDPELVSEVLAVIKDLARQGRTMVIVTHQIRFAEKVADQVLFVDGGHVVEKGSPTVVIGSPAHARTRQFLSRILDPG